MKKFLMVATVPSMIGQFNMDNIKLLLDLGYEVHAACNYKDRSVWSGERVEKFTNQLEKLGVKRIQIEFARTPYDIQKLVKACLKLRVMMLKEKYTGLHCHTPVAGLTARLAALGTRTKVIYTAHGFHFFRGAPARNWLMYYPAEKLCSSITDVLITINQEDYALAKRKMKAKKLIYIPGVGIDLAKFRQTGKRKQIREECGIPEGATFMFSVGELNENKNHEAVICALADMEEVKNGKVYYAIAGQGVLKDKLRKRIKETGLDKQVFLLGFRMDVAAYYEAADIYVFPSLREGLSVSLMEAMASGLPVACSKIRGNTDAIDGKGGYLFDPKDIGDIRAKLESLLALSSGQLDDLGNYNLRKVRRFDKKIVESAMTKVYVHLTEEE